MASPTASVSSRYLLGTGTISHLIRDMRAIAPTAVRVKIWERKPHQVRIRVKLKKWRRRHDEQCLRVWRAIEQMRLAWAMVGIRYEIVVT
jgi:hypothetical protein